MFFGVQLFPEEPRPGETRIRYQGAAAGRGAAGGSNLC